MPRQHASQRSFLSRRAPAMPEGYYSSGPNPNLRRFVEEHATPYDPATDDYDVPPFSRPIKTTKATAIYNMHTYWSKKPHDAIQQYIRHYTKPGDLVLDPFCGSGSTALAALMEGRAAIAIDLSPAATFITKNYCTAVDPDALQAAFEELERKVKPEIDWLYETRCDRCGGRAATGYTVYSQTYRCPRCMAIVPLFDCPEVAGRTAAGKPRKVRVCPHCHARGHDEEISTRSETHGAIPVLVSYLCQDGCKPQRAQRAHNDPDPCKREYFQRYDLAKIAEIEAREIPHWVPPHKMMNVEDDSLPWGDKWRAGTSNFRTVADLFSKRNLWALAAIRDLLPPGHLQFAFSAVLLNSSRLYRNRTGGGGGPTGTYYLPQESRENPVWPQFEAKVREYVASNVHLKSHALMVSTNSATCLDAIPSDSIDLIFTDPPYAGKVQYGELNFIWEAWLGLNTNWHESEITVNATRGASEADWTQMMRRAMAECYRVLKPGRWISLCYHDTSEGTWQLVQDIMAEVGLISDRLDRVIYIDTDQKTYNQLMGEKVTKRDPVISFRKPRPGEAGQLALTGLEDAATFREKATAILREALERRPGSTADVLYDELVSRMVRRGVFERHDFDALLRAVAEPVAEPLKRDLFTDEPPNLFGTHERTRWYLKETADRLDEAEGAKEAAAAEALERFMTSYLEEHSAEEGVHYGDLFERYLPVRDKPRRQLAEWLPEFFFRTEEGTWRPPASEEERLQKEELRQSGTLRRVKRFARALLEGNPPAERDRPANAATALEWLRQCVRAGLYDLGRAIYERGGVDWASLDEEAQLDAEEQYELCARRQG